MSQSPESAAAGIDVASANELCAQRLRLAFELFDAGVELKRASLRRQWPKATDAELHDKLQDWLFDRPGAPLGDVSGPTPRGR